MRSVYERHHCHPPAAALREFQAAHGPLESPISGRIFAAFIQRQMGDYFEPSYSGVRSSMTLDQYVSQAVQRHAPALLKITELSADWHHDPLQAAERVLRDEMAALAKSDADAARREDDAARAAAVKKVSADFLAQLQAGAAPDPKHPTAPAPSAGKK